MPKSYTGAEFSKALSAEPFRQPIVLTGMVKQTEDDSPALMFAEGGLCRHWVKIPIELIDSVEYLATTRCQDHDHPFVTLYLKDPSHQNPAAGMLADLLRIKQSGTGSSPGFPNAPGGVMYQQSSSGSHGCVQIPIIKVRRPPTGPEGYPADPGWEQYIEYITVCW